MRNIDVLVLIPARGGSISIPRKNIRPFAGHPLIAYSIAAAMAAETVTRVLVSTDDAEIAAVARRYGAETPFLRPDEFSQDNTPDLPVFQHALRWLAENENYQPEIVVQLRPTSPIRPTNCVDHAVSLLLDNPQADSVRGVVPSGQNPYKMWRIEPGSPGTPQRMVPLLSVTGLPEPYNAPRQLLPATYWQTGHIDAIRVSTIYDKKSLSGDLILPLVIDLRYTIDIDTLKDWQRAETLVTQEEIPFIRPSGMLALGPRPLPSKVSLVIFDFDGVKTDNRVWVDQDGREMIAANRSDSMGLNRLRQAGVQMLVLSTESNPVVAARCRKINLPLIQNVADKAAALHQYLETHNINPAEVVYLGNDINDLPFFPIVGCAVVVADVLPEGPVCRESPGYLGSGQLLQRNHHLQWIDTC